MTYFICQSEFQKDKESLFAFHEEPRGFEALVALSAGIEVIQKPKSLAVGETAILRVPIFLNLKSTWIAKHILYEKNKLFVDKQISGPFSYFEHHHKFKEISDHTSILTDQIEIRFPFWPVSKWFILPILKKQFSERHKITAKLLNCQSKLMFCGYSVSVID
ncbi:hypothetical protein EHQ58_14760 [Leptospira ognonensis]|uniref:Cell division inhibitor n=1 Tax=Leptospira ognonensis TaxID=2484945 RepID=A0A4R9JYC6_9LEPT|nr:SRPBCC family protein [Leptospira ognonensis]TGL57532.1 hypothetical protein EHQ58_14760 [Leptospira ognonensis]